jgi:L-asparaginase II
MTPDPVLVEVTRGGVAESVHRGAFAVVDATGRVVVSAGDLERPVFPRSAIKALQALPLVESGAADVYRFTEEEIALACASHGGEERHVATAAAMLAKAGLGEPDLECGSHWPSYGPATNAMIRSGTEPCQLHNNCSGKHSGMLAFASHRGIPTKGYVGRDHPVQQAMAAVLKDLCDVDPAGQPCGIDGCSIPTWGLPLRALALGFARFATGHGLSGPRAAACRRIAAAVFAHPFMVAGTGRFCTEFMEAFPARAFVKTGAEGVFCGFVPEQGLGFALKVDDGATRASEAATAALLHRIGAITAADIAGAPSLFVTPVLTRRGAEAGTIRAVGPLG